MLVWLKLNSPVARGFVGTNENPTGAPDLRYERLLSLGALRRPLLGETSNIQITLDNSDGQLSSIFSSLEMLQKSADVRYDEDGTDTLLFSGIVDEIGFGPEISIRIIAGLSVPETQAPALRTSAAWTEYPSIFTLSHGYGRVTFSPYALDGGGRRWFLLDHSIEQVEQVLLDGKPIAYDWRNTVDETGTAISVLDLFDSVDDRTRLSVTVRGKLHPNTGELIENPATVLWDILANINGGELDEDALDAFRSSCDRNDLSVAGMIDDSYSSTRDLINELLLSVGGVYSAGYAGLARLWPVFSREDDEPISGTFTTINIDGEPQATSANDLYTVAEIKYNYDYSASEYKKALRLQAPASVDLFGERILDLNFQWCPSAKQAQSVGTRLLQWYSRPRWEMQWQAENQ